MTFIGVWLLLFAGTMLVRSLWGSTQQADAEGASDTGGFNSLYGEFVRQTTRIRLDGIPRRSGHDAVTLDASKSPRFDGALGTEIRKRNDTLYECVRETISLSVTRTNYFEFSFYPMVSQELGLSASLSDVVLERVTIKLTAQEEACLVKNLTLENLEHEANLQGRFTYIVCINQRS